MPEHVTIDVTPLKIGDALRVSDLPKSDKYRILSDPDLTLVVVSPPAKAEVVAPAAAEAAPAAPAEPEAIKKGKAAGEEPGETAEADAAKKKATRKPAWKEGKRYGR